MYQILKWHVVHVIATGAAMVASVTLLLVVVVASVVVGSELVYLILLLNSQGVMSDGAGVGQ